MLSQRLNDTTRKDYNKLWITENDLYGLMRNKITSRYY